MSEKPTVRPPANLEKKCAKCGACTAVCPVYRASGNDIYSARGKRHLAEIYGNERPSPVFEDIYSKCLLCGACTTVCPRDLDITEDVMAARNRFSPFYGEHGYQKYLAKKALNRPELLGAARILGKKAAAILFGRLPAGSGLRLRLAMLTDAPSQLSQKSRSDPAAVKQPAQGEPLAYFPGCAGRYLYPEIADDVIKLLQKYGYALNIPDDLGCCGLATMASGDRQAAQEQARKNIIAFEQSETAIMVSCGSCFAHLTHYPDLFDDNDPWHFRAQLISERVVEISRFLALLQDKEERPPFASEHTLRVFYHDPCHMRHDVGITSEPRTVLKNLDGVELLELPDGPQCCGQGGLFHVGAPDLSAAIRDDLAEKVLKLGPDVITTTCSGCIMQLKTAMAAAGSDIPVLHFSKIVEARSRPHMDNAPGNNEV